MDLDKKQSVFQQKIFKIDDLEDLNVLAKQATETLKHIAEYTTGEKNKTRFSTEKEVKSASETVKLIMNYHKYRMQNPLVFAFIINSMSQEDKKILKETIKLVKEGE